MIELELKKENKVGEGVLEIVETVEESEERAKECAKAKIEEKKQESGGNQS